MESIIPGKDYFPEVLVASQADAESDPAPAEGRDDVQVIFSATDGGDAIAPELSVDCTDTGATKIVRGQSYQIYTATLAGADTIDVLVPGDIIYRRTVAGTHDRESVPVIVRPR